MGKMMSVYAIEADTRPQTVAIAVDVDRRAAVRQSSEQIRLLTDRQGHRSWLRRLAARWTGKR
jgi:hypothetical protein